MVKTQNVYDSSEINFCSMCRLFSAGADFYSMSRGFFRPRSFLRSLQSSPLLQSAGLSPAQLRYSASSAYPNHGTEKFSFKSADAQQRWNELRGHKGALYPRAPSSDHVTNCRDFLHRYATLKRDGVVDDDNVTLCGMPEAEEKENWNNSCP